MNSLTFDVGTCIVYFVQRLGLGDGREIYILPPERQPNKELKVQKKYKSPSKKFQPGLQPNNEQKADETHVSPAIAKPNVCVQRS